MNRQLPFEWGGKAAASCAAVLTAVALAAAAAAAGPVAASSSPLDALRFLAGSWRGEGSGQPGTGNGRDSFRFDLDGRVLVRRSHAEYPPSAGRPAVVHDDLMVIYPAPGGSGLEAAYFDNEGHVIRYEGAVSPDGRRVVFTSAARPGAPRFRLTYSQADADTVDVTFEIAPPGAPDAFRPYVSGRSRRVESER